MFYNVENLFDPFHDTLKNDYEFVRGGSMGWTWKKFDKKLKDISKVIIATGGWSPPEIIALSEVENRFVLIQLLKRTPLERFGYKIVHEESPDERGIDVALLYKPDRFKVVCHQLYPVVSADTVMKTRGILYVKGLVRSVESEQQIDTLHFFVNHWPSRTGGIALTMHRRKAAALTLRHRIDSILNLQPEARIVITGDLNDEPTDESVRVHLGAQTNLAESGSTLYNLMMPYLGRPDTGTNKFRGQWGLIDQFIVSSALLNKSALLHVSDKSAEIVNFPFLLERDEAFSGTVPVRTYKGRKYYGGFSDHLPVLLTLKLSKSID